MINQEQISIIVPVLNEAEIIQETLRPLLNDAQIEIIVVDGGSTDATVNLVTELGVKVIVSPQSGRAKQMNLGAEIATGDILLFLHADTHLPTGYVAIVRETLAKPQTIAGAFELKIDAEDKVFRLVEKLVNWRSHLLSLPYGDQGIFLRKSVFQEMGGFPNLPIMEDFEFIRQLRKKGKIRIAPANVLTSSRRWQKLGIWQTTLINQLIIIGYFLGISPEKLSQLYRSNIFKQIKPFHLINIVSKSNS